jgi:hypothetical protein
MLTFGAGITLIVLLWMAFAMSRMWSVLEDIRRSRITDPKRPDIDYPAFSRDQISHAYDQLAKALNESLAAEQRLFTAPGWKGITSGDKSPDRQEEDLMHECSFSTLMWEVMLSRCQFLTEANLRVCRGDWTIAQARYYYRELEPSPFAMELEVKKMLEEWRSRFKRKNSDEKLREYQETMRPHETARAEFLAEWKGRFKVMRSQADIHASGGQRFRPGRRLGRLPVTIRHARDSVNRTPRRCSIALCIIRYRDLDQTADRPRFHSATRKTTSQRKHAKWQTGASIWRLALRSRRVYGGCTQ